MLRVFAAAATNAVPVVIALTRNPRCLPPPLSAPARVQVRRFHRFVLGEGMEKKVSDLAADVAAATGGKA